MPRKDTENTDGVIRMPKQHVRPGRGTAGYKSVQGEARVEVYETRDPYQPSVSSEKAEASADTGKTRQALDDEATELGLNPADYPNKTAIAEAIAEARAQA